jgi:hypothetical protein
VKRGIILKNTRQRICVDGLFVYSVKQRKRGKIGRGENSVWVHRNAEKAQKTKVGIEGDWKRRTKGLPCARRWRRMDGENGWNGGVFGIDVIVSTGAKISDNEDVVESGLNFSPRVLKRPKQRNGKRGDVCVGGGQEREREDISMQGSRSSQLAEEMGDSRLELLLLLLCEQQGAAEMRASWVGRGMSGIAHLACITCVRERECALIITLRSTCV